MADCQARWFTCLMMVSSPSARTCSLCLSKNEALNHLHVLDVGSMEEVDNVARSNLFALLVKEQRKVSCPSARRGGLVFEGHNLRGTGQSTLAALQTVGMQIADGLAARVVGRKLHRTDAGALLALHLTGT